MNGKIKTTKHSNIKYLKQRIIYACVFLALVIIEILIALFVHDSFIRPFGGDIIIVGVLYCFIRIIFPNKFRKIPFYVFIMALIVEIAQYFHFAELLGFDNNPILRTALGTTFSFIDIICYGIGALICLVAQILIKKYSKPGA